MILIGFNNDLLKDQQLQYPDKILIVDVDSFKTSDNSLSSYPMNLLGYIKTEVNIYDIVFILYSEDIPKYLTAIKLPFYYIYNSDDVVSDYIRKSDNEKFILNENFTVNRFLSQFNWFEYKDEVVEVPSIMEHKPKSLADIVNDDVELTDMDLIDLKKLQNKLKMGVLLQAKSMLNRVLKLSDILDKLYDELLGRVENSIHTTDTASLMRTIDSISKALSDTNQFIVSLVNNEKIQNFFIVDNSTVINTGNDTFDIDKRERIRKAAEIILNNYDNLANDRIDKLVDPNTIVEVKDENRGF